MDEELSRKVCQLIAGIVVSDEELDDTEDAFIDRMLAKFGLAPEDRDLIFPIVDRDDAVAAIRELPEDVATTALSWLIDAACVDGVVVDVERQYLLTVAEELKVSVAELDKRIEHGLAEVRSQS